MRIAAHYDQQRPRSFQIAKAFVDGVQACGGKGQLIQGFDLPSTSDTADCVVAYGWRYPELFEHYQALGKHFIYADLGWWDRKPAGAVLEGFHKIVADAREPTAYFRRVPHSPDRFNRFGLKIAPWRALGGHILLAGMSAKSAKTRGYGPYEWEYEAIRSIREITDREIVYRPKPSWDEAKPIPGTTFSPPDQPLINVLHGAWAVVTLHSNVAIDGYLAGIPALCLEGVGSALSMPGWKALDEPPLPEGREALMADIAYLQWALPEIRSGECWRHLRKETPLCS